MMFAEPRLGDTRVKEGFALFPVSAQNGTVWLCQYVLQQTYVYYGCAHWMNICVMEK